MIGTTALLLHRLAFPALPSRRAVGTAAFALAALGWMAVDALSFDARITLAVFMLAIGAWTVLRLPEAPVALAAAGALVLARVLPAERLYATLADPLIWLLIGAFLMAAALQASGVAQIFALRLLTGARTVRAAFYRLTLLIVATAFVIPSTTGRAALLLPVFLALAAATPDAALVRAYALLFPSVILLSACASLLGAGAHLIAADHLQRLGLPAPTFLQWAALGVPVAVAASASATELILRLFIAPAQRAAAPLLPATPSGALTAAQKRALTIAASALLAVATEPWHGVQPALVMLLAALAATSRRLTGIGFKQALKSVEWNLILFLAATLALGQALTASGAAPWIAGAVLARLPAAPPPWLLAFVVAALATVSHLLVTSRSARAAILIPALALPLAASVQQAPALVLLVTMASGFCQTLRVSAKPVALFARGDGESELYGDADLLRLAVPLMAAFVPIVAACALWYWPLLGVSLGAPPVQPLPQE